MTVAEIFETMEYGPAPESSSLALKWIEERGGDGRLFINNEWCAPQTGEYFDTINPATARPLARIPQAGPEDVDAAGGCLRPVGCVWFPPER
jgi:aldehyde dehydrogenase (NAD+)